MLKQGGGIGWVTDEMVLGDEDKLALEVSTFIPGTRRAYVSWVKRTYCAKAGDSLDGDGEYFKQLVSDYGKPTQTMLESQIRAEQYESKMAEATKLADKQEAAAKTPEDKAAVQLLREEIALLGRLKDEEAKAVASPKNRPLAYVWQFDAYAVAISRLGDCADQRPRYVLRLSTQRTKSPLFSAMGKASSERLQKLQNKRSEPKAAATLRVQ